MIIGCIQRNAGSSFLKNADPFTSFEKINLYLTLAMKSGRFKNSFILTLRTNKALTMFGLGWSELEERRLMVPRAGLSTAGLWFAYCAGGATLS